MMMMMNESGSPHSPPSLRKRERESTRERKRFFEFCFSASKHNEFFFHCS